MSTRDDAAVVIVGAGIAALAAALSVQASGGRARIVGGPRGLSHLASGAWDQGPIGVAPAALRPRFAEARRAAQRAVIAALGGYRAIPFRAGDRPLVATIEGRLRHALSIERNVLNLGPLPRARVAVIGLAALPLFDARALARSLDEDALQRGDARRFFAVDAEHARRVHDVLLSSTELARTNEPPAARQRLALALRRAVADLPCEAVLLPPVLGAGGDSVTLHLERALGRAVGEVLAARSTQSERLSAKLEDALTTIDPLRLRHDATSIERGEHGVVVHVGSEHVKARAVILCTGRELAGGLRGGHASLVPAEASDGVDIDAKARITSRGAIVSERVFAAGSLVKGLDPARAVAFGAIAASGWIAGTEAARS